MSGGIRTSRRRDRVKASAGGLDALLAMFDGHDTHTRDDLESAQFIIPL